VRIGGNMADDGMIYVFDFAKGSGHEYGKVLSSNNKVYKTGQSQAETIHPVDHRKEVPENYLKMAFGIRNFNYTKYVEQYTQWTVADFKQNMPEQYRQMKAWLKLRYTEYKSGERTTDRVDGITVTLADISPEQKDPKPFGVLDMLGKAKQALDAENPQWMKTPLPELQETAIRSFTMKCIALKNGKADSLYDLGAEGNAIRKVYLRYLLKE